ncbi:MAG: hypothetical protein ACXVB0_02945 [Mucilaginibacter sp.]
METKERTTPITGKEGAEIKVHVAADWTRNHRLRHPGGTISQFFGFEILQRILQQPDCMGIRIYYANSAPLNGWQRFIIAIANFLVRVVADADGEKHLILTGVTKEGLDQIPVHDKGEVAVAETATADVKMFKSNVAVADTTSKTLLAEQAMPCPGAAGCPQNVLTGSK